MTTFQEPTGLQRAGSRERKPLDTVYEVYMKEQEIPIFRGIGCYDIRDLPRAPWKQMGGLGTLIDLDGTSGLAGMYVLELPAAEVTKPERHIYEERLIVFEGRGTLEVWVDEGAKRQVVEWQAGTLISPPLNTWHRLVNASSSPAVLLAVTNAPLMMNAFHNRSFIFENPFVFSDRYDPSEDYFKASLDFLASPEGGRAMVSSNIFPDIFNCYLPLDNNRGPGHRHFSVRMVGNNVLRGFIAEYPSGRYSKAHAHPSQAVLVCLRGGGYSVNWPQDLGIRPWESGFEDQVNVQFYKQGGMVSAAPGGGFWFHQHFATHAEGSRVFNYTGGVRMTGSGTTPSKEISEGGTSISYVDEDPYVRQFYQDQLQKNGTDFAMPEVVYRERQASLDGTPML